MKFIIAGVASLAARKQPTRSNWQLAPNEAAALLPRITQVDRIEAEDHVQQVNGKGRRPP